MSKYTAEGIREFRKGNRAYHLNDVLEAFECLLRERESAKAVLDALGYVPGELDKTAPERIWLQIDTAASSNDREEPWPGCDDVTWQDESIGGLEIQYVRADLVVPMLASARVPDEYADAFKDVLASLVASVSLLRNGGRKAAASDKMFSMMLNDYEKSITRGRSILLASAPKPETEGERDASD